MADTLATCPKCNSRFAVEPCPTTDLVSCSNCKHLFSIAAPEDPILKIDSRVKGSSDSDDFPVQQMPLKFLADDPDFEDHHIGATYSNRVLLPDGKGGVQSVDNRIVKIQHKGKTIELIALPPDQKRRRQRIINLVSILLGVLFLVLFFVLVY